MYQGKSVSKYVLCRGTMFWPLLITISLFACHSLASAQEVPRRSSGSALTSTDGNTQSVPSEARSGSSLPPLALDRGSSSIADDTNETDPTASEFQIIGTVGGATKYSFDVQTDRETIRCFVDESSEFALRLTNPWFDFQNGQVIVDGQLKEDGTSARVAFELPPTLHLLTQFRNAQQMDRALANDPIRINHYLLSPELIEPGAPDAENLIMAGEIVAEGERVSLVIGQETKNIRLGFKGATIGGRSISDLTIGKTKVVVTGQVRSDGNLQATTVIFRPF